MSWKVVRLVNLGWDDEPARCDVGERRGDGCQSELRRGWPALTGHLSCLPDDLGLDRSLPLVIWELEEQTVNMYVVFLEQKSIRHPADTVL